MSPAKLKINTTTLRDAGKHLTIISNEFGVAGQRAKEVASQVGGQPLEGAVRAFADKWDHHRERMKKAIDALDADVKVIAESFDSVDKQLGDAISKGASGLKGATTGAKSSRLVGPASPSAAVRGGVIQQFQMIEANARQRLAQIEAQLAVMRQHLEELRAKIGAEMEILQLRRAIEAAEARRDAILALIHHLNAIHGPGGIGRPGPYPLHPSPPPHRPPHMPPPFPGPIHLIPPLPNENPRSEFIGIDDPKPRFLLEGDAK